ncbi:MAG: HAMP domain-containing protein [Candidatus Hodarchaeota archaeon]
MLDTARKVKARKTLLDPKARTHYPDLPKIQSRTSWSSKVSRTSKICRKIRPFSSWTNLQSIVGLSDIAQMTSRGQLDTEIPFTTRNDEIGDLANSFKRMTASLKFTEKKIKTSYI